MGAAVVIIVIVLAIVLRHPGSTVANVHPATEAPTVPMVKVLRETLVQSRTFEAEFRPYQTIDLHASVAGFVQSINVDVGDSVKEGDVLAVLSIPGLNEDLDRAAAAAARDEKRVAAAAATYEDAHLTYTRIETVDKAKPHLVAKQDLDSALAKDKAAEAALAEVRETVRVSKAELAKLQVTKNLCTVKAPFSGVITKRYADQGALVQGGVNPSGAALPLVRLSQNDRLRLTFPITVTSVPFVKIGDPVQINITTSGKKFEGAVTRFTRNVEMATRTMDAEVDIPNPDLAIIPGVYAEVMLKLDRRDNAVTIPATALSSLKTPTAFVLAANNTIEERPLTLGFATGDKFEVVSGLKENEMVMVGSRAKIEPGQKVEPKVVQ